MIKIIFICHSEELVKKLYNTYENPTILFVGLNSLDKIVYPDVIIVRDLQDNIEYEKSLLTFTAWYAIVKNNLFKDEEHMCILEYDVKLDKNFKENLEFLLQNDKEIDIISFVKADEFLCIDVNYNILRGFIESKGEKYINITDWYATTNHCIKKTILKKFVDWYYPDYLQIKNAHSQKLAFYHERLFYYYISSRNFKNIYMEGLEHFYSNSHGYYNIIKLEDLLASYTIYKESDEESDEEC